DWVRTAASAILFFLGDVARPQLNFGELRELFECETGIELDTVGNCDVERCIGLFEHLAQAVYDAFYHEGSDFAFLEAHRYRVFAFADFNAHTLESGVRLIAELIDDGENPVSGIERDTLTLQASRLAVHDMYGLVATGRNLKIRRFVGFACPRIDQEAVTRCVDLEGAVVRDAVFWVGAIQGI